MAVDSVVLEERGVLSVAGEDAASFLHGLVTNDVEGLGVGEARFAALLTPQGKILFDFFIYRAPAQAGAAFLIDCPAESASDLARRLSFYRLRAKVTIADVSADLGVTAFLDRAPTDGVVFADPRDARLGWRAIAPRAGQSVGSSAPYEERRIACRAPRGGVDFAYGDVFPHDVNMDLLNGVDFQKGCYVGQEVVSRMRHRGGARKRIVALRLAGPAPAPGTPVLAGQTAIGVLGSSAGGEALALLRVDRLAEAQDAGRGLSVGEVAASPAG